jgi:hypothetical protein
VLPKVKVHISDYGFNRERAYALAEKFGQVGAAFFVREYDEWQTGGAAHRRDFDAVKLKEVFARCFMTNCYSFTKGRLYGCPRAAHGINMGATPDYDYDYADFNAAVEDAKLREALKDLIRREYLLTCGYCDGYDNKVKGVPAAIQI